MRRQLTLQQKEAENLKSPLVSLPDTTQEYANTSLKDPVFFKGFRGNKIDGDLERIDIAHTILSAEWKGISNLGQNGVIEWQK